MFKSLEHIKPGLNIPPVQVAPIEPAALPRESLATIEPSDSAFSQQEVLAELETIESNPGETYSDITSRGSALTARSGAQRYLLVTESVTANRMLPNTFDVAATYPSFIWVSAHAHSNIAATSPVQGLEEWRLPSSGGLWPRVIVPESSSTSASTLLDLCVKLVLLFQGVTGILNSLLATVLALIAYNRSKVDQALKEFDSELDRELKRLQIVHLQGEIEKQARERQKDMEAIAKSGIILSN